MAISVDTVYQRVLAIANKEQRGYITPQEYNLLANQAQMQIFESYFFTKNLKLNFGALINFFYLKFFVKRNKFNFSYYFCTIR